jgi:hypothetical protein
MNPVDHEHQLPLLVLYSLVHPSTPEDLVILWALVILVFLAVLAYRHR